MSDILRAPINYGVAAGGQFVKGGSVLFGFENIRPDADNPATLKAIFLDDALTLQASNPQGLSSDATFDQADNGVLFGETGAKYSIIIYDANDVELSYIPSYDLSDASASITAQDAANAASASAVAAALSEVAAGLSETNTLALYIDFVNRYFGAFASDPAVDDEGNPPVDGSLYWNTVNKTFKAYDSGVWYLPQDLGFGTMAYVDAQTSPTDATAGRGVLFGAFGLGSTSVGLQVPSDDCNAVVSTGFYFVQSTTTNSPLTGSVGGTLTHKVRSAGSGTLRYTQTVKGAGEKYERDNVGGIWSVWQPVYTGANYQPETTQGLGVVRIMRNLSGGSVAENASVSGASLQFVKWSGGFAAVPTGITGVGTWKNVSSVSVDSTEYGMFVRIA